MPHHLQEERALPNAWLSPDKDHGAGDDPPPQHPVQFPNPGVHPAPTLDDRHLAQRKRLPRSPRLLPRRPLSETDDLLRLAYLLDEGAPLTAVRTTPEPLRRLVSAVRTNV